MRPRILYDRLHEQVFADTYSRMLAVAAGGTIPDKGMYTARTEDGVKVGELDEEFVYESQLGDRFLLGSFAWKIVSQDKDTVVVTQSGTEGARLPFWKGEIRGRSLGTSLAFGRIMRTLAEAERRGTLTEELEHLGLDRAACENTSGFLQRQLEATGILPDDKTIVVEHFRDSTGSCQIMLHALFGKRINTPLSLLLQDTAQKLTGNPVGSVEEEDGILLYPYGENVLPEGLLFSVDVDKVREILEAMRLLGRTQGVFGEPAGAAGTAGVKKAVELGLIPAGSTVVSIVTGNGLKDVQSGIQAAGEPMRVSPDMDALLAAFAAQDIRP